MSREVSAFALAEAQVAAVRDDPAARVALMARLFHGPTGRAPRHVPFRLAALSFMRWQAQRGVLNPIDASPPGYTDPFIEEEARTAAKLKNICRGC